MPIPFYLINVFTSKQFNCQGNPCAVIHLEKPISADRMQALALYLNQPATAFIHPTDQRQYGVRWFAPDAEILICGHGAYATFASLWQKNKVADHYTLVNKAGEKITGFGSASGAIEMTMSPIIHEQESKPPSGLSEALGCPISGYYQTNNKHIVRVKSEEDLSKMNPNFELLRTIDVFGYSVTAEANNSKVDFVSRTLIPHVQQLEDFATGSSHAALFPFWSKLMHKSELVALQLSSRGGYFQGSVSEAGVTISSNAVIKVIGSIDL